MPFFVIQCDSALIHIRKTKWLLSKEITKINYSRYDSIDRKSVSKFYVNNDGLLVNNYLSDYEEYDEKYNTSNAEMITAS